MSDSATRLTEEADQPAILPILHRALAYLREEGSGLRDPTIARHRLALQLPRHNEMELQSELLLREETSEVVKQIRESQGEFSWVFDEIGIATPTALSDLRIQPVGEDVARAIHERFHYIGSYHSGLHFGLFLNAQESGNWPLLLLTFSTFDLWKVAPMLDPDVAPKDVLVLSRVYSFPTAPPSAFSYAFRRALLFMGTTAPKQILTFVNPNIGFTGSSYRAANWEFFRRESTLRYAYVDGIYVTSRQLLEKFGTNSPSELQKVLRERFSESKLPLAPLQLFSFRVNAKR